MCIIKAIIFASFFFGNQGKNSSTRSKKSPDTGSCTCHHHNQLFIDILKSQEEHIEQLSKRMAQLVKLNKAQIEKTKEPEKKTVGTMTDVQEPVGQPNSPRRESRQDDPRKAGASDMCSTTDSDFYSTSLILTVASSKDSDNEEALYEKILKEVDNRLQQSKSMKQRPKRTHTSSPTYRSRIANFHHPRRYSPSQESILISQLTEKYLKDNKSSDRFKNRE